MWSLCFSGSTSCKGGRRACFASIPAART